MDLIVLGALEYSSFAIGIKALDEMVKVAPVKIIDTRTISSGKYLILFTGDVASAEYSFQKGTEIGGKYLVDSLFLPMIHPEIVNAIGNTLPNDEWESIGIIETFSIVAAIEAADRAAKAGGVNIIEIRLANGFGGKSYVKMMGNLDALEAAMESGTEYARSKNQLCMDIIIPKPHSEIKQYFM